MSARVFKDAIAALLIGDATFVAAVTTLLGAPITKVLSSNLPVQEISAGDWPCFVIEQADGKTQSISNDGGDWMTIGNSEQHFESDLDVFLIWSDQDREHAADVRSDLSQLFVQLLLRNPSPGGIASAWVDGWRTDGGIRHPHHIFAAVIRGQYAITKE